MAEDVSCARSNAIRSAAGAPSSLDFVVPCGRPESAAARATLKALARIHAERGHGVIAVGPEVGALATEFPDSFRWVDTGGQVFPATARNLGAAASTADLLAFLDDDCSIDLEGLLVTVDCFRREPELAVLSGRIVSAQVSYLGRVFDYCSFPYQQADRVTWDTPLLVSAFMAVRRDLFSRVCGFDERLRYSEDVDLVRKLLELGCRSLYTPAVKIVHAHDRTTWPRFLRYQYQNGSAPYFLEENHQHVSLKYRLKLMLEPVTPLLLPALLVVNVLRIVWENVRTRPEVLWYLPGLTLGRLAFELGRAISRLRRRS